MSGCSPLRNDPRLPDPRELVAALSSADIMVRVEAIADFVRRPDGLRPALAAILVDAALPLRPRVWAMIALCQMGEREDVLVSQALVDCLTDPAPIIRRSALETLGVLRVHSAVRQIAGCLADHAPIPEAWFDDDATPSQAAKRALESIASPEAKAILASTPDR
jgi:HEAT repeat protein